ncbi:hypothetical protein L1D34_11135 [Vibrio mediterranei]|uniref:hypothetical protein n=1 Tax=Vibrio mediterranei TaxID=689 RepID=UPI001EFCC64D|nr:hypothetical protein [Vibrio mediterranei]MCG9625398.1 hypothetical protein [Vibrio mediterranei]
MYKKQFINSFNTTKLNTINLDDSPIDEKTRSRIYSTIQSQLGQFSAEEVSQQCFGITSLLKNELEKFLNTEIYYTLGYILLEGKPTFHTDLDTLKSYIGQDITSSSRAINLHAWLTTSSGEIIDATLMTTIGVIRKQPELLGGVIASFNESLKDLSYHPQIIGEQYLKDCSFMVDFDFWELS